jgi:hypothetical protein
MITIDFEKAKAITKDRLRAERAPLFEQLDVAFMRAVEAGDAARQTEIAAQKQALRDVTNLVDACATTDELKALKVTA